MKLSNQQLGLVIVLGAGLCAIGVDRFLLRPEGGVSSASAALADAASSVAAPAKSISKEPVDRSTAAIADRLERLPLQAITVSRDAFSEPWNNAATPAQPEDTTQVPVVPLQKTAPWTLTSVTSIGGNIAVVLNRDIVLNDGSQSRNEKKHVELVSARLQGDTPDDGPFAIVKDTATGEVYKLVLGTSTMPSKR